MEYACIRYFIFEDVNWTLPTDGCFCPSTWRILYTWDENPKSASQFYATV